MEDLPAMQSCNLMCLPARLFPPDTTLDTRHPLLPMPLPLLLLPPPRHTHMQ